jgi:dTDP-4-amino-4,6-dideoxygalactose transaminase
LPVTERIARETVTLPLHAGMQVADVDRVCAAVSGIVRRRRP